MLPDQADRVGTGLILGEGEDEIGFFRSLVKHLALPGIIVEPYVYIKKGRDGLEHPITGVAAASRTIKALRVRHDFDRITRICATRDVDDEQITNVMRSLGDAFGKAGLPTPDQPSSIAGSGDGVRVGVFLLPGQGRGGILEDLCLDAIRDDPAWPCLESYFTCLDERGVQRSGLASMISKAKIHAWLASREDATLARLGIAAEKGYIDWEHTAFGPLKNFLRELFDDPSPPRT